jgi:hypothetical protein
VDSQFVQDPDQDFNVLRFGLREWDKVKPYLLKDFYVLTPWHSERDTTGFTAYCYYDPEASKGVLLAFRQERCQVGSLSFRLPFGGGPFRFRDEDTGNIFTSDGDGTLEFPAPRTAKLIWVEQL